MITIKIDAPRTPDQLFNIPLLLQECEKVVEEINNESLAALNDTKKTFSSPSTQFDFRVQHATHRGKEIVASVSTDNENYIRLNQGTEDHIVGKGGKWMSFYPEYTPKTRPRVLTSFQGGPGGIRQRAKGPWLVSGIEPRKFTDAVSAIKANKFFRKIDQAFEKARKGSI